MFGKITGAFKKATQTRQFSMKSAVAVVLFGAIILVFIFFGLTPGKEMGVGAAGRVNNSLISVADFHQEAQRLEQMYAPLIQAGGEAQRQFIYQQALENLIGFELVAQLAQKEGIYATDAEIRDLVIHEIPAFQENGRFQRDLYVRLLEANRMTPGGFEEKLRKERQNSRLRQVFEAVGPALHLEKEKVQQMASQKINVEFIKLDQQDWSQRHPATLEQARQALSKEDFLKRAQDHFAANQDLYKKSEQVRARHILLKSDPAQPGKNEDLKKKILEIKARLKTQDFATVAKQVSQDEGSKAKGGDLGFFEKGKMLPEFEEVAFSLPVGQVSEPVQTLFGFHLIEVLEKRPAQEAKFENSRLEIAQKLLAEDSFETLISQLEKLVADKKWSEAEALLKAQKTDWVATGFFDLSKDAAPGLTSAVATSAAWKLTKEQPFSSLVRDGSARFWLRLKERKVEATPAANLTAETNHSFEFFNRWLEQNRKVSRVERNPRVLQ